MASCDEIITLVNEHNQVIGEVERSAMRFGVDIHRVSFILVFLGKQHLLVQKRTENKAFCPGYYGVTTGGVVAAGESYEYCAERELEEEIGVALPLNDHGLFFTEGEGYRIWGKVFSCHYCPKQHGELTLQPTEVASVHEMSIKEILHNPKDLPFVPDAMAALHHYLETVACESLV